MTNDELRDQPQKSMYGHRTKTPINTASSLLNMQVVDIRVQLTALQVQFSQSFAVQDAQEVRHRTENYFGD